MKTSVKKTYDFVIDAATGAIEYVGDKSRAVVGGVGAGALALGNAAHAAVPATVTTAITDTGADLITVITAVIVAFVAFWGMRKLGAKMGWL